MTRVLITGMSGAGKSTLLEGLSARGYLTVDTDVDDWTLPAGRWDETRMGDLLAAHPEIIVSGTVENQATFYDQFDHIVLLSAPLATLMERITTRTNNPYGKSAAQQAEIAGYVETVEPLLRRGATLELDGRADRTTLVDAVEALL